MKPIKYVYVPATQNGKKIKVKLEIKKKYWYEPKNWYEPKISVVVLCRNEISHIRDCIASLAEQNINVPYEILIVDGMSEDGTRNVLLDYAGFKTIRVIDNKKKLTPYAWNLGFKHARGDYIAVVSAHGVYSKNWLRILYNDAVKGNLAVVGGVHISPKKCGDFEQAQNEVFNTTLGGFGSSYSAKNAVAGLKEVKTVAFALYDRRVIEKVGAVNTAFIKGQDMEYNYRIRKLGCKIFQDARAVVYYRKRKSFRAFAKQMYGYGFAKAQMMRTHRGYIKQGFRAVIPACIVLFTFLGWFPAIIGEWLFGIGKPLFELWCIGIGAYMLALSATDLKVCWRNRKDLPIMVLLILCHFFYGYGFLIGLNRDFEDFPEVKK